ncbi:hypothetical protein ACH427_29030 [Streptomyces sp. NPDC020379]
MSDDERAEADVATMDFGADGFDWGDGPRLTTDPDAQSPLVPHIVEMVQ